MIFVPQLAVVEFKLQQPEEGKRQLESLSEESFFFSYNEQSNNGIFYKLFPKKGGRFLLENTEYIFKPLRSLSERPRVRLILATPSDFDYLTAGNELASLVRRIKMVALMAQSVIATALRQRYGNDTDGCLTFFFDADWEPKTAGPFMCAGEDLPALAVLKTYRASAELYGTKDIATYFIKCLELLGERNPLFLLNLIFVLPRISGNSSSNVSERFETKRDVSVVSSPMLTSLPDSVSSINTTLTCTKQLNVEHCRSLSRIISYNVANGECIVRHTIGGAVASLLGAVVHELGHLFKLPHTKAGIMNSGENEAESQKVDNNNTMWNCADDMISIRRLSKGISFTFSNNTALRSLIMRLFQSFNHELVSKRISESLFDDISLDLLHLSRFIVWNTNVTIHPIRYERDSRLLNSDAGIVRVVYITGCSGAHMLSYLTYPSIKQLQLDPINNVRVLAIASDGNSAIFAL